MTRPGRCLLAIALLCAASAVPGTAQGAAPIELVGALHEHSGYSDGYPGSTPRDYFAAGRREGLDFLGSSEHSDNADLPNVLSEYCADVPPPDCANADPVNPLDAFRKWDATQEQATAASTRDYTGFRGFEWTSDRFGHINVFFSADDTNAKTDGGYVALETFYDWLRRSDGIATFNHPGAKSLDDEDPGFNWNDFRYDPAVDEQMVGIETFNDPRDYGSAGPPEGWYARALDRGWHVGAVGAEDLGHKYGDDWGGPSHPKTVVLAAGRSPEAIEAALRARRSYAIRRTGIGLKYTVDGRPLGSRLQRPAGAPLRFRAQVDAPSEGADVTLDLVTGAGRVVATGDETLDVTRPASAGERYYFVRARRGAEPIAYSSPVWVTPAARSGEWLAGDLHVHSCYSGDVYCGPDDDPATREPDEEFEEAYTFGFTVGQRFSEAAVRGLDFTSITDHNDVRSVSDPGFGTAGVVGLPGYENSLRGHAQMLGARKVYDAGDSSAGAVRSMAGALRADGGAFQINHPDYRATMPFDSCSATGALHWTYGYDVTPDTIEIWNPTSPVAPAEAYWECWLGRGARIAATGGGDSHWAALAAAASQGDPTTSVLAAERTADGLMAGLRAGRTTLSRKPPAAGGTRLLLEADADRDGTWEAAIGDEVSPGARMRVRSEGGPAGFVTVRANGRTLVEESPLAPGQALAFDAPLDPGWVRARLVAASGTSTSAPGCTPNGASISTCAYDQQLLALTSPIYLAAPVRAPGNEREEEVREEPETEPEPTPSPSPATTPGQGAPSDAGDVAGRTLTGPAAAARRIGLTLRRRPLRSTLRRRKGVRVRVACSAACDARLELRAGPRTARRLGVRPSAVRVRLPRAGSRTVLLRLPARALRRLRGGQTFSIVAVSGDARATARTRLR